MARVCSVEFELGGVAADATGAGCWRRARTRAPKRSSPRPARRRPRDVPSDAWIHDRVGGTTYRRRQRADVLSGAVDPAGGPDASIRHRPARHRSAPSRDGLSVQAIRVDYEPGGFTRGTHRHPAGAYVYVIDGRVEFGIDGREPVLLKAGESFYEPPGALHSVSRNASDDLPASLIAFFVLAEGEPPTVYDHD